MKLQSITLWAALLLLAGGMQTVNAQEGAAMPGTEAWQKPEQLQQTLAAEVLKQLPGTGPKEVEAFIKSPQKLRLLLHHHLACAEAALQEDYKRYNNTLTEAVQNKKAEIERLQKEADNKKGPEQKRAQYLLECARKDLKTAEAEAKYPATLSSCDKVLKAILADAEWMRDIAFSGEMHHFTRVVQIINAIAAKNPGVLKKGTDRDIATAIAVEFARYNARLTQAVERAEYFLKNRKKGRLNTVFDTLPMHQRRVVCGWKHNHSSGTIKAFEWALDNVHLPDWQYPASCWRCGYVLDNVYGDSVHGAHYYAPWAGVATDNHMWLTKYVGGVCGGLSHFGAASACANGVPALTSGEPGHCSYIVLVNGKWTPAYSLSWERGLHWLPWNNNYTYSSLHLTDDLYAAKAAKKTQMSDAYRMLARVYQDNNDTQNALACYKQAAKAAPLNYPMWRDYAAFVAEKMPKDGKAWQDLNSALCKGVAAHYPEQAAELLQQFIYGRLGASGLSARELTQVFAEFWKHAEPMGPDRWHIERLLDRQLQICKNADNGSEDAAISLYTAILAEAAGHDAYSGSFMGWGNKMADSLSNVGQKRLKDSMLKVLGNGKNLNSAQKAKMLGGLMLSAEQAGDTSTFYSITGMIDPKEIHGTAEIPEYVPFPGKLVSKGGLPFASSTSEWDAPHTHSGLLTNQGGKIHTAKDSNAWIAVKLPKHAYITGVVFAGTNEWKLIHRFRPLRIQVSDTGKADDWHDVGEPIPNTGNYINRFDLQSERPKALYVRVLRPGGPEFFHANGIYIFGEPAA